MTQLWPTKLLWIDLEMTGLDPNKDRITEVAAIVTDFDFKELASYQSLIKQPATVLNRMKKAPWYNWSSGQAVKIGTVYDMHQQNGLLERLHIEGKSQKAVEDQLLKLVQEQFDSAVYLAGNSIHQDRRFISRWWPRLEKKLHYRMVDVSSFKVYMQGKHHLTFRRPDSHRAIDGIRGSIEEMQYYLNHLPKLLKK